MDSERFAIGERGYYVFVSTFNEYLMVHFRKFYQGKPTKFGIALTPREYNILMNKSNQLENLFEQMDQAMQERLETGNPEVFESELFHIGWRGF